MKFKVIDTKTGKEPDIYQIALREEWANGLMYCDMEGFAIEEDGTLMLVDECGRYAYCPLGRFKVEMLKDDEPSRMDPDPSPMTEEMTKKIQEWVKKRGIPDPAGEDDIP
jgi:hypothetical protein